MSNQAKFKSADIYGLLPPTHAAIVNFLSTINELVDTTRASLPITHTEGMSICMTSAKIVLRTTPNLLSLNSDVHFHLYIGIARERAPLIIRVDMRGATPTNLSAAMQQGN